MDWTQLSNITSHSFHRFKIMPITSGYGKQNQKSGIKWASREFNFEKEGQITREKIKQVEAKILHTKVVIRQARISAGKEQTNSSRTRVAGASS